MANKSYAPKKPYIKIHYPGLIRDSNVEELFSKITSGNVETVKKFLFDAVINWQAKNKDGDGFLHLLLSLDGDQIMPRDRLELTRLLLEKGVPSGGFNKMRQTPLHLAVQLQDRDIVELLIEAGADSGLVDYRGRVPLHYAILGKDVKCPKKEEATEVYAEQVRVKMLAYPIIKFMHENGSEQKGWIDALNKTVLNSEMFFGGNGEELKKLENTYEAGLASERPRNEVVNEYRNALITWVQSKYPELLEPIKIGLDQPDRVENVRFGGTDYPLLPSRDIESVNPTSLEDLNWRNVTGRKEKWDRYFQNQWLEHERELDELLGGLNMQQVGLENKIQSVINNMYFILDYLYDNSLAGYQELYDPEIIIEKGVSPGSPMNPIKIDDDTPIRYDTLQLPRSRPPAATGPGNRDETQLYYDRYTVFSKTYHATQWFKDEFREVELARRDVFTSLRATSTNYYEMYQTHIPRLTAKLSNVVYFLLFMNSDQNKRIIRNTLEQYIDQVEKANQQLQEHEFSRHNQNILKYLRESLETMDKLYEQSSKTYAQVNKIIKSINSLITTIDQAMLTKIQSNNLINKSINGVFDRPYPQIQELDKPWDILRQSGAYQMLGIVPNLDSNAPIYYDEGMPAKDRVDGFLFPPTSSTRRRIGNANPSPGQLELKRESYPAQQVTDPETRPTGAQPSPQFMADFAADLKYKLVKKVMESAQLSANPELNKLTPDTAQKLTIIGQTADFMLTRHVDYLFQKFAVRTIKPSPGTIDQPSMVSRVKFDPKLQELDQLVIQPFQTQNITNPMEYDKLYNTNIATQPHQLGPNQCLDIDPNIVEILVQHNSPLLIQDKAGKTPLDYAAQLQYLETIKILQKHLGDSAAFHLPTRPVFEIVPTTQYFEQLMDQMPQTTELTSLKYLDNLLPQIIIMYNQHFYRQAKRNIRNFTANDQRQLTNLIGSNYVSFWQYTNANLQKLAQQSENLHVIKKKLEKVQKSKKDHVETLKILNDREVNLQIKSKATSDPTEQANIDDEIKDIKSNIIELSMEPKEERQLRKNLDDQVNVIANQLRSDIQTRYAEPITFYQKEVVDAYNDVYLFLTKNDDFMYNQMWKDYLSDSNKLNSNDNIHLVVRAKLDSITPEQAQVVDKLYENILVPAANNNGPGNPSHEQVLDIMTHTLYHIVTMGLHAILTKLVYTYLKAKHPSNENYVLYQNKDNYRRYITNLTRQVMNDTWSQDQMLHLTKQMIQNSESIREFLDLIKDNLINNAAHPISTEASLISYLDNTLIPEFEKLYQDLILVMKKTFDDYHEQIQQEAKTVKLLTLTRSS